jgi:hypothetical protein
MGWGDELMALGEAQALAKEKGGKIRILDAAGRPRAHPAWLYAPEVARPAQNAVASIRNGPNCRPYVTSVDAQAWHWRPYKPRPARLYLSESEQEFANGLDAGFVVVEPNVKSKGESVNRSWGFERFAALVALAPEFDWVQLAQPGAQRLPGARLIPTETPRLMAAAMSKAGAYVGPEGGMHHTAAAFNVPGVVIFGHYVSPKCTGYDMHRNLFEGESLGCGMRIKCQTCRAVLAAITPAHVLSELRAVAPGLRVKIGQNCAAGPHGRQ